MCEEVNYFLACSMSFRVYIELNMSKIKNWRWQMSIIIKILATLVALEHLYIMYLETFKTDSDTTSRVFGIDKNTLATKPVNTLLKNQGVYNGLLAVLILISVFVFASIAWATLLLSFVVLVAIYGGFTSSPSIIIKQGLPAAVALLSILVF